MKKKMDYDNQYAKAHYHRIALNVKNEVYEDIKYAADISGESVSGFIRKAIDDRIDNENIRRPSKSM